jgi:hypothetical protein
MHASEKFKTDLGAALARASRTDGSLAADDIDFFFRRNFPALPRETGADILATFLERAARDREKAAAWLGSVASIFCMDYDEAPLSAEDWTALRESANLGADEMDIELLSYVMALVLDHHAL